VPNRCQWVRPEDESSSTPSVARAITRAPRIILIVSPSIPGAVYDEKTLRALLTWRGHDICCSRRHLSLLCYGDARFVPATFTRVRKRTIIVDGVSKLCHDWCVSVSVWRLCGYRGSRSARSSTTNAAAVSQAQRGSLEGRPRVGAHAARIDSGASTCEDLRPCQGSNASAQGPFYAFPDLTHSWRRRCGKVIDGDPPCEYFIEEASGVVPDQLLCLGYVRLSYALRRPNREGLPASAKRGQAEVGNYDAAVDHVRLRRSSRPGSCG